MNCLHCVERYKVGELGRAVYAVVVRADFGFEGQLAANAAGTEWTADLAKAHRFPLGFNANLGGCPLNAVGDWPPVSLWVRVGYGESLSDLGTPQPAILDSYEPDPVPTPVPPPVPDAPAESVILDESAATYNRSWDLWPNQGWGGSVREGWAGDWANWLLPARPGRYRVEATWTSNPNRQQQARFAVASAGKPLGFAEVNQRKSPSGPIAAGSPWQMIGDFDATGTAIEITLTGAGEGRLNADAVRITWLEPLPVAPTNP